MDRLKGVEYFKRIYELGSFTAAADEFRCSNAVISKYVKFLESWTGAKLILRNTRTISFTDEGHRFSRQRPVLALRWCQGPMPTRNWYGENSGNCIWTPVQFPGQSMQSIQTASISRNGHGSLLNF